MIPGHVIQLQTVYRIVPIIDFIATDSYPLYFNPTLFRESILTLIRDQERSLPSKPQTGKTRIVIKTNF